MCRNLEKEELLATLISANPQPPQNPIPNANPDPVPNPKPNLYPAAPSSFADFEVVDSQIFSLPHSGYMPDQKKS